jgi:arylsulfatase A-like enzyme/Tfp pilus assembly protein PilF
MDTTRADHLGCYGNRSIETPVLDDLARGGVLCAQAVTPVPATLPGHASLLTGLYPFNHGARANGTFKLEDSQLTLAEILRAEGYRTGAAVSAFVLDGQYGLDQGFDLYDDDLTVGMRYSPQMFRERAAELTNEPARAWLGENGQERFFFWVHYFDPHAVYLPPEPYRDRYAHNLYDGEIAYLDAQIGDLLEYLDTLGVRDRTLVIVASDHGEGLGEHGEQTHSLLVYDSTLHVPLIFHAPGGIPGGRVLHEQVSLVDVMPTVLDLLGVQAPPDLDGRSLIEPPPDAGRPAYVETLSAMTLHGWAPLMGVRRDDCKFILAPEPEVYDLRADPRELENLYRARPDLAMDLHAVLKDFLGEDPWLSARVKRNMPMDEEALEHLRALGYVGSAPQEPPEGDLEELPDPKVMVHHWERVQQGVGLRNQGNPGGAIELLSACLEEVPRDVFARQVLASTYAVRGEYEQALEHFTRALELAPGEVGTHLGIANMLLGLDRIDDARNKAYEIRDMDPERGDVYVLLARIEARMHNEDEAFALLDKAIELDPGSAGPHAYNFMGHLHHQALRCQEAREAFNKAIEIDGLNGEAHAGLARILIQEGNLREAKRQLAFSMRFDPVNTQALATYGGILSDEGRYEAAEQMLRRALEITPRDGLALNNLGLNHRRRGDLELAEATYRQAIECSPHLDLPHLNLAQLYLSQGKEAEAIDKFRDALRANPFNTIALFNVGTYLLRTGQVPRAALLLQQAVRIRPDYALAHKHLGAALLQLERREEGILHLEKSLELDPTQPGAGQMRFRLERIRALPAEESAAETWPGAEADGPRVPADPAEAGEGGP